MLVPVSAIFEDLKCSPIEEVLENFHVTRDQVQSVLDSAAIDDRHTAIKQQIKSPFSRRRPGT
ncbi:MAG: hypothetical protein SFV51_22175 [Bryobacteraceae bacterium]|nr:hypothetical protein [Bryobacteraceae bacterium]